MKSAILAHNARYEQAVERLLNDLSRYDLGVFAPESSGDHFVKRVVSLGGEWIELRDGDLFTGPAEQRLERQVKHLVGLVDDLLDVSRITRGKVQLKRQKLMEATEVELGFNLDATAAAPDPTLFGDFDPTNQKVRVAIIEENLSYGGTIYENTCRDMLPDRDLTISSAGEVELFKFNQTLQCIDVWQSRTVRQAKVFEGAEFRDGINVLQIRAACQPKSLQSWQGSQRVHIFQRLA